MAFSAENCNCIEHQPRLLFFSFITDTNLAPCEQKIEDVKGVIKTAKSGTISDCTWLITVPAGHNIFLKFTTLELEFKYDHDYWLSEKKTELQVWDGHNESSASLGIYRGTKRAFSLQSSGRCLFIRLRVLPDTVLCNVEGLFLASTVIGKSDFGLNLAWSGLNPDIYFTYKGIVSNIYKNPQKVVKCKKSRQTSFKSLRTPLFKVCRIKKFIFTA